MFSSLDLFKKNLGIRLGDFYKTAIATDVCRISPQVCEGKGRGKRIGFPWRIRTKGKKKERGKRCCTEVEVEVEGRRRRDASVVVPPPPTAVTFSHLAPPLFPPSPLKEQQKSLSSSSFSRTASKASYEY